MRRRLTPIAAAATAVAALVLTSLGGGSAGGNEFLPGSSRAGPGALSQVPVSTCAQWRRGSPAQRRTVIDQLDAHFGHETSFFKGAVLPGDEAYTAIDGACAAGWARNIRLYKIYARALAFRGLAA